MVNEILQSAEFYSLEQSLPPNLFWLLPGMIAFLLSLSYYEVCQDPKEHFLGIHHSKTVVISEKVHSRTKQRDPMKNCQVESRIVRLKRRKSWNSWNNTHNNENWFVLKSYVRYFCCWFILKSKSCDVRVLILWAISPNRKWWFGI